jgi:DNA-binding ferritin-like protein
MESKKINKTLNQVTNSGKTSGQPDISLNYVKDLNSRIQEATSRYEKELERKELERKELEAEEAERFKNYEKAIMDHFSKRTGGQSSVTTSEQKVYNDIHKYSNLLTGLACLSLHLKELHWTWRGDSFISYHQLFDEYSKKIEDHLDDITELLIGSLNTVSFIEINPASLAEWERANPSRSKNAKDPREDVYSLLTLHIGRVNESLEKREFVCVAHEEALTGLFKDLLVMRSHFVKR